VSAALHPVIPIVAVPVRGPAPSTAGVDTQRQRKRQAPKGRRVEPAALADLQALWGDADLSLRRDLLIERLHGINDRFGQLGTPHLAALAQQIRRVDEDHVDEILELMPLARRWYSQRERATTMALCGDTWLSDILHIKTYVALRHWCWMNDHVVDDPPNTHDQQRAHCQEVDGILPRWVDHCACELD